MNERVSKTQKREWMGIEPTKPLFRGFTGFEARGSHQIYKHSRNQKFAFSVGEQGYWQQKLSRLALRYQLYDRLSTRTVESGKRPDIQTLNYPSDSSQSTFSKQA